MLNWSHKIGCSIALPNDKINNEIMIFLDYEAYICGHFVHGGHFEFFLNLNLMTQKHKIYVLDVNYIENNEIIAFSIFWWLFWQPF